MIVVLLQTFEWNAIIYIVESQSGRTVGEIMYDHGAENMNEGRRLMPKFSLRRKEELA